MFYVLGLFVDDFVLVSDYSSKKIYQISLKNADVAALNLTIVTNPLGLAWNSRSQHIFWSDGPRSQIHKARLDGSNYSIVANPGICFSFFSGKNLPLFYIIMLFLSNLIVTLLNIKRNSSILMSIYRAVIYAVSLFDFCPWDCKQLL